MVKFGPSLSAIWVRMGPIEVVGGMRCLLVDSGENAAHPSPIHLTRFLTLIAAKDTLLLTPFTNSLRIVPRMAKSGPFLAALRVWMGDPRKWRARAHYFWKILTKIRPSRRLARRLAFQTLIADKDKIFLTQFTRHLWVGESGQAWAAHSRD